MTLLAFVVPPASVTLAWLATRIAIHYSFWDSVMLWRASTSVLGCVCLSFASWYAARGTGWTVVIRFLGWVTASVVCTIAGVALIELIPITVGDGP